MRHFSFPLLIHFEFGRKRRQGRSKRRTWNLIRLHVYKKGDEKKKTQQSRTRARTYESSHIFAAYCYIDFLFPPHRASISTSSSDNQMYLNKHRSC